MFCLIRPPAVESFRFATTSITLPLGLAYIAAALEAEGRPLCVIDAVGAGPDIHTAYYKGYLLGLTIDEIVSKIPLAATCVGITVVFTHEWPAVVQLIEHIKAARPDLLVILGGEHVTAMAEFSLQTSHADILVLGEGEETIIELTQALDNQSAPETAPETALGAIAGIAWRRDGEIIVNPRRVRRMDIDAIAPPAWHLFDIETYHAHRFVGGMYSAQTTIPILATRGCPYQCTYCSAPNMWTPRWIPRDPKLVVDEIAGYVKTYGAGNFPFQDLTAIVKKDWIVAFCSEILARGLDISWQLPTGTRSEAIDGQVAELMARSGMVSMAYAPESGSDTTRRLIKKKMKAENLFESIRAAAAADLNAAIFLVIGFPHDCPEHLAENLDFIDGLAAAGITDLSVGYYMALPGTELFHSLYDAGQIHLDRAYFRHILDSLALIPSQSYCPELSRAALMGWKIRLLMRFYKAKHKVVGRSVWAGLRRIIESFHPDSHETRLQSAFRNGLTSALATLICGLKKRWMPQDEEAKMFAGWDDIYRHIREIKRQQDTLAPAPADTTEIHKGNVIDLLRKGHETQQVFKVTP